MPAPQATRQSLLDELRDQEIKHSPEDIVKIGRTGAGDIVFLEIGNSRTNPRTEADAGCEDSPR